MVSFFNQFLNCKEKASMKDVIGERIISFFGKAKMISFDCVLLLLGSHAALPLMQSFDCVAVNLRSTQ
jgi:hypothetical protein